jgi:proteasome lid subunit RPN8/RPN11
MSDFNWCHGPECHTKHTVDRVRGVKGSKVLRTRKIRVYSNNNGWYSYFCSQSIVMKMTFNKHIQEVLLLHQGPRLLKRRSWTQRKQHILVKVILIIILGLIQK